METYFDNGPINCVHIYKSFICICGLCSYSSKKAAKIFESWENQEGSDICEEQLRGGLKNPECLYRTITLSVKYSDKQILCFVFSSLLIFFSFSLTLNLKSIEILQTKEMDKY